MERRIQSITGIPVSALRGEHLSGFGIDERLSWAKNRATTRQEDGAYSLLGMFDIQMPLLYGEGREKALVRLRKEIDASDLQVLESRTRSSTRLNPTRMINQLKAWTPRYWFMYGQLSTSSSIQRSFSLDSPPAVYRAFLRGCSVASLGRWKVLLNGPADGVAEGIAYKFEHEWQEAKIILAEAAEWVPESCIITMLTGDGKSKIEGKTFKYCGTKTFLEGVPHGASPFKDGAAYPIGE